MIIRKVMDLITECKGCKGCNFYPFFHYVESKKGFDIEFIKYNKNHCEVTNYTTNESYIYNGNNWIKL